MAGALLEPITAANEVKRSVGAMRRALRSGLRPLRRTVGTQAGTLEYSVYYDASLGIWFGFADNDSRYWTMLGTQDARNTDHLTITCEANVPHHGVNRRVAGALMRDEGGTTFFAHSGNIGGGRKGVGKTSFLANVRGYPLQAVAWPDGQLTDTLIIGPPAKPRFRKDLARFVREVERVKALVANRSSAKSVGYTPEFRGERRGYTIAHAVRARCDHGHVVDALAGALEREGFPCANDQRDLFIPGPGRATRALFEVKTDCTTGSIYAAIGQLLYLSANQKRPPVRVLVVPSGLTAEGRRRIARLGIRMLEYRGSPSRGYEFAGLPRLLQSM